jgi:hypothetical protein
MLFSSWWNEKYCKKDIRFRWWTECDLSQKGTFWDKIVDKDLNWARKKVLVGLHKWA